MLQTVTRNGIEAGMNTGVRTSMNTGVKMGIKKKNWALIAALALLICLVASSAMASSEGAKHYMANSVYMYAQADPQSTMLAQLGVGEEVVMYSYNPGADGEYWHYIMVVSTGERGYIPGGNITTQNPRPTETSSGTQSSSGQLVVTNTNGAALRNFPQISTPAAYTAASGTVLTEVGTTTDITGAVWYYVAYQGDRVYVRAADVQRYVTPGSGSSSGQPANPGNGSTATAGYRYVVTASRYVNLRSAPSTSASVVAQVPAGEIVTEQMSVVGSDGKVWRFVSYGGKTGYMRYDYLTVVGGGSSYTPVPPAATPTPPPKAGYSDFVLTASPIGLYKEPSLTSNRILTVPQMIALRPVSTHTDSAGVVWYQVIYSTAGNDQVGYVRRTDVLDNPTWDQLVQAGAVTPSPTPSSIADSGYLPSSGYLVISNPGAKIYSAASGKDPGNGNYDFTSGTSFRSIDTAGTIVKLEKTYYSEYWRDYIYLVQYKVWGKPSTTPTPLPDGTKVTDTDRWMTYSGYIFKYDTRNPTTLELATANNSGWGSLWQPTAVPTAVPTAAPPAPYQIRMGISHVALRTGPSTSASMVMSIAPSETAQYLSQVVGADGYTWYQISFYGKTGWVRGDLVTAVYPGGAVANPTATSGANSNYTGMMAIANSGTNMRSGMGTSFGIVTKLSRGEIVTVKGSGTGTDGNTWYQVTSIFTQKSGYVRGDLLRQLTAKEQETYNKSGGTSANDSASSGGAVNAPPAAQAPSVPSTNTSLKLGMTGSEVALLQSYLATQGHLTGNYTSGTFDATTYMAVRRFQEAAGLTVDGVAGTATLAKLYSGGVGSGNTGSSGSSGNTDSSGNTTDNSSDGYVAPNSVELNSWTTGNIKAILEANPVGVVVVSVDTGASFRVKYRWGTNHADCEPQSASDTAVMNQIKASYGTSQTRYRMPVWVKVGGHTFAASMYAEGHDASSDTIPGNNFSGVMCLHFKDSSTHTNPNGTGTAEHQQEVMDAYVRQPQ